MLLGEMLRFGCLCALTVTHVLCSECAHVLVAQDIALAQAEAKRVKIEKKEARRAALKGCKENTPLPPPPCAIASPLTKRMPGLPLVSVMPVPISKSAESVSMVTVAPVAGSLRSM